MDTTDINIMFSPPFLKTRLPHWGEKGELDGQWKGGELAHTLPLIGGGEGVGNFCL